MQGHVIVVGERWFKWEVVKQLPSIKGSAMGRRYRCRCECGNESDIYGQALKTGRSKQCVECASQEKASKKRHELLGTKVGLWTISDILIGRRGGTTYALKCICGRERFAQTNQVENIKSTGCVDCYKKGQEKFNESAPKGKKWHPWRVGIK